MRLVYPPAAAAALREPSTTHEDEIPVERSNTAHDQASMRESECKDFREVPKSAGSGKRHRRVRGASRRQLALVHAEGATGIQRGNARYCAGCGSMIDKLAALVPRPRFNLVQVSWCTCSAAEWGPYVVPSAALPDSLGHPAVSQKRRGQLISSLKWDVLPGNILHPALGIISWAELLHRVFSVAVLECPKCSGRMRILAAINPPEAIRKILNASASLRVRHRLQPRHGRMTADCKFPE